MIPAVFGWLRRQDLKRKECFSLRSINLCNHCNQGIPGILPFMPCPCWSLRFTKITTKQRPISRLFLLAEPHRQDLRQSVASPGLGRLEGMGVDVQRGRCLGVSQGGGDGLHVLPVVDQQRSVQMPELVNPIEGQPLFLTKATEPFIGPLRVDWAPVLFGEQVAALVPLIPQVSK